MLSTAIIGTGKRLAARLAKGGPPPSSQRAKRLSAPLANGGLPPTFGRSAGASLSPIANSRSCCTKLEPTPFADHIAMDRSVKARIGAARILLEEHAGTASHQDVSFIQARALVEVLGEKMKGSESAEILELVTRCRWWGGHQAEIVSALAAKTSRPVPVARRQLQDYTKIYLYADKVVWEQLNADVTSSTKLQAILNFAASLGLRCPSEPTYKVLCSWWMLMTSPDDESLARTQKHGMLAYVKTTWSNVRKCLESPVSWLQVLPMCPAELLADHELLYKQYFKLDHPAGASREFLDRFSRLESTYGCRNGLRKMADPSANLNSTENRLINALLDKVLTKQTDIDVQYIQPPQRLPRSLSSLSLSGDWEAVQTPPPHKPLAICNAVHSPLSSGSGSPEPFFPLAVVPRVAPQPVLAELPEEKAASFTTEGQGGVGDAGANAVCKLVTMMAQRKAEKASTAARKRPAAAEAEAESTPENAQEEADPSVGAPEKKAKAKAAAKVAIAVAPKKGAKSKAKPAPEEGTEKTTTKKKGAQATEQEFGSNKRQGTETKNDGATEQHLVLGCSKCRWRSAGCAKCKSPTFSGKRGHLLEPPPATEASLVGRTAI